LTSGSRAGGFGAGFVDGALRLGDFSVAFGL
jgi:hypothetical protein